MNNQEIYTNELVLLLIICFIPPLFIAYISQVIYFTTSRKFKNNNKLKIFGVLVITGVVSSTIGILLILKTNIMSAKLGIIDVALGGIVWPVLPLAFIIVGFIAPIIAWGAVRSERKKA